MGGVMSKFTLTVNMDGVAFEADPKYELRRIFKRLVVGDALRDVDPSDTRYGANQGTVRDVYGNTCGQWVITDES